MVLNRFGIKRSSTAAAAAGSVLRVRIVCSMCATAAAAGLGNESSEDCSNQDECYAPCMGDAC